MRPTLRSFTLSIARFALLALCATALGGCSLFQSDDAASSSKGKKGWTSYLPFGGSSGGGDATQNLEYQRTRSKDGEPLYTLNVRNTHLAKTIEGQMRTTMETGPGEMKVDSQSFVLAPNEEKKLLVYPARFPLTYEVTATFRD